MRILLVEDEPLIREILAEELRSAGFHVCEAGTADDALALMAAKPCEPSLLVTDIHMPGSLDGIALGRVTRTRFPDLPIVYITGRPDVVTSLGTQEALVRKPFTPSDILGAIRQLLRGSAS